MYLWVNRRTGEKKYFPYSYEQGLPVGGPEDMEGTPLWVPCNKESK